MLAAFAWCLAIGLIVSLIDNWRRPAAMIQGLTERRYFAVALGVGLTSVLFGTMLFGLYVLARGVRGLLT